MRSSRFYSVTVLAVVLSALVGGFFGSSVLATQDEVQQQYRVFTAALAAVDREYVEDVPSDRLVYGAIEGMLKTLDPHSSFFDPKQYAQMRERQEGKYYGLGIQIQVIDGDITVMSIFEGSPAYKKGLRRGDVIARISGADAKGWTSEQAVSKLKGPKGTTVNISLRRRGYDGLIDLDVERDEVNIVTVRGAFMIDKDTAYIKLGDFSETSDDEVGAALKQLTDKGMKRLVFDLRDNPGGPLEQAIRIANRFLPRGDMIVYTRGRVSNSDQDYHAEEDSAFTHIPLVVLVNRNSASASEIVTGALQDHDRGLVVGETTFGKALVQSVYRISGGAGLALTTGRYYTPSGRMIQRPWDGSFDEYLTYTLRDQNGAREHSGAQLKYTEGGRKVYSGGGIEPDKFMAGPVEGFNPTRFGRLMLARGAFANFADQFTAEGDTRLLAANKNKKAISKGFAVTPAMVQDFRASLKNQKVTIDEASFSKDEAFILTMIKYDIDLALFGVSEARRNLIAKDPQAQFALSQFPDAIKLTDMARNRPVGGGKLR
ncbi:MAG TPA: S41 family peptidase [Vicinamibacterales bacterium]|jgi:carboxyl-terminal processing protease|nr:S41 family peptidase [Vicinamibacterales bacterium]